VSPLWRDEVGIFIGPAKIALARMRRGMRPKCISELETSLDNVDSNAWQPACDALTEQLDNALWHDANARIVISDHWVRYAILPWSAELSGESERAAHAKLLLANTYGDLSDEWVIRISDSRPLAPAIVSAMPRELLNRIEEVLRLHKLRPVSLQPNLIVSYNARREHLPNSGAWFASVDDGSLATIHHTDGRCDRVSSVRISDNWTVELRRIQTTDRLALNGSNDDPVYVDAPALLRNDADKCVSAIEWLDDGEELQASADKVSLMKGMYS
jgi:hypothetical protein